MMSTIFTITLWILVGAATAYLAYSRGRDPYVWFALGIFFGILALLVLVFLPPLKSDEERAADERDDVLTELREQQVREREKIENTPDQQPQSVETKDWFYLDQAKQQQGPISFFSLNGLWESGEVTAKSYVWSEGMLEWKHIQDLPDLLQVLEKLEEENRKAFPEDL